ncbi:MAG: hypothetical protein IT442_12670 [Phycisphaeraceae bacterium]|nr:hypothetical protein [Phycisphaeraceae bacterium]
MTRGFVLAMLILGVSLATACRNPYPKADKKLAAELSQIVYPKDAPLGEDLDILVRRDGGTLRVVNRTPRKYENVQLWLNQQWVGKIDAIDIGQENTFSLGRFINQYGEKYPTAGLLNPDRALKLVLADIFDPATGKRHRLTVLLRQ